jgi:leader peptidase (prepilin peptidase)/N-methyltransferase
VLSTPDLIPFFSWALLRGRCRHCRARIGWRYPVIELCTMLACLLVQGMMGLHAASIILMIAMPFLVAMIAIDLEFMILPDQINIILGVLGAVFIALNSVYAPFLALKHGLIAAAIYAGLVFIVGWVLGRVLKKEALGLGDVKFFAVAGLWLGVGLLPAFLMLSGVCGVIMGAFWKVIVKKDVFPFGHALIVSFVLCVLFQAQIQGVFEHFM